MSKRLANLKAAKRRPLRDQNINLRPMKETDGNAAWDDTQGQSTDPAADDPTIQPRHASEMSHGDTEADLPADWAAIFRLLTPTPETPGFDLCSPRVFQVWLALFVHALYHGRWGDPKANHDPRYLDLRFVRSAGLYATWTEDLLARTCGIERKTVERCLLELLDLGWLRKTRVRDAEGHFAGFSYILLVPPSKLESAAIHRYEKAIAEKQTRLDVEKRKLDRGRPDYVVAEQPPSDNAEIAVPDQAEHQESPSHRPPTTSLAVYDPQEIEESNHEPEA